jgi:hypothetical protein
MTRKTEHLGRQTGGSSDKWLSPSGPYTGDGQTSRQPHDAVTLDQPAKDLGRS